MPPIFVPSDSDSKFGGDTLTVLPAAVAPEGTEGTGAATGAADEDEPWVMVMVMDEAYDARL